MSFGERDCLKAPTPPNVRECSRTIAASQHRVIALIAIKLHENEAIDAPKAVNIFKTICAAREQSKFSKNVYFLYFEDIGI